MFQVKHKIICLRRASTHSQHHSVDTWHRVHRASTLVCLPMDAVYVRELQIACEIIRERVKRTKWMRRKTRIRQHIVQILRFQRSVTNTKVYFFDIHLVLKSLQCTQCGKEKGENCMCRRSNNRNMLASCERRTTAVCLCTAKHSVRKDGERVREHLPCLRSMRRRSVFSTLPILKGTHAARQNKAQAGAIYIARLLWQTNRCDTAMSEREMPYGSAFVSPRSSYSLYHAFALDALMQRLRLLRLRIATNASSQSIAESNSPKEREQQSASRQPCVAFAIQFLFDFGR